MAVEELQEIEQTKFDMTVADMQIIDRHRVDALSVFMRLRGDIVGSNPSAPLLLSFIDSLQCWFFALSPLCKKDELDAFDKKFDELFNLARLELNILNNRRVNGLLPNNVPSGASEKLLTVSKNMVRALYLLKHEKGLGIKQQKIYTSRSSNRVLDAIR